MTSISEKLGKYFFVYTDRYVDKFIRPSALKRFLFFILGDTLIVVLSLYLAIYVRFDFRLDIRYIQLVTEALPLFIAVKLVMFAIFKVYKMTWRFVGLTELYNIVIAILVAELVLMVLLFLTPSMFLYLHDYGVYFPRGVFILDALISFLLVCFLRISRRIYLEVIRKKKNFSQGNRTLIVGAGSTGELVLRAMARRDFVDYYPIGILDDNPMKVGAYIHGVRVIGVTDSLSEAVRKYDVEVVIISIPSTHFKVLRKIHHAACESGVKQIKIVPDMYKHQAHFEVNLKELSEISIEDLIGRQAVEVEYDRIEQLLVDKTIMVTGACGSIGSEIVRQVCSFNPARLILFEIDETELHDLRLKLNHSFPEIADRLCYVVGDIRDAERVKWVVETYRPQLLFHAAAYKHVPMMEDNSSEAVKVNIFGTHNLALACRQFGVERFVMISTDKAVMPTSVMGATKRVAEYICTAYSREDVTEYTSVRFGNVLGSRGSVLPLFMEQLKRGGPLTVTDPEMQRYFMTIPEAVSLVLQAAVIGKNGEVLILDMGEPVKVLEMAEELIRLHGLKPYEDIAIEFVGLRPGEKMFEEILTADEGTEATCHEKIFVARNSTVYTINEIKHMLEELTDIPNVVPGFDNRQVVKDLLMRHVQHYKLDSITGE